MTKYDVKKVLIISDTHRSFDKIAKKVAEIQDIDLVIHLGDFENEEDYIRAAFDCPVEMVRGNCDYRCNSEPDESTFFIGKYKAFITHGHAYGVKKNYDYLIQKAKEEEYDIVMFGHTHKRIIEYIDDIILINPGSAQENYFFGKQEFILMEIDENGEIHLS